MGDREALPPSEDELFRRYAASAAMSAMLASATVAAPASAAQPAEPGASQAAQPGGGPGVTRSDDAPAIRLEAGTFRPQRGEAPDVPPGRERAGYAQGQAGYWLVQFDELPVTEAKKAAVESTGASLVAYVPDGAFKVRMTPEQAEAVEALDEVGWVGLFHPAYVLSPDVTQAQGRRPYTVRVEVDADLDATLADIRRTGATVERAGGRNLQVTATGPQLEQVAQVLGVAWVDDFVFNERHNEFGAGVISGANVANASGFDGSTQTVAVADTGLGDGTPAGAHADIPTSRITAIHDWPIPDYGICVIRHPDGAEDPDSGHGTHTSVSVLGGGNASGIGKGTAPEADLVFQAIEDYVEFETKYGCKASYPYDDGYYLLGLPDDLRDLYQQAYDDGARVHSNSWGSAVAGDYTPDSVATDDFVWLHPDMTITFSAGNEGIDANGDGAVDVDSIGSPGTAKNAITVGASENVRTDGYPCDPSPSCTTGFNSPFTYGGAWGTDFPTAPVSTDVSAGNAEQLAAFSSRGPTNDGRIKPDVVAPGTWVLSGYSDLYQPVYDSTVNPANGLAQYDGWGMPYDQYYKYMGGTSMSNPIVAGGAAVVRDYYNKAHEVEASAALVKATLINSAVDLLDENNDGADDNDFPIPNMHEGWGRMDLAAATDGSAQFVDEATGLATAEVDVHPFEVASGTALKVSLVWSDQAGTETASADLVNDLDLMVASPSGERYLGNVFSGGWSMTGGSADTVNNVENVYLPGLGLEPGEWTVEVRGANVPDGPQPYAIVVDALGCGDDDFEDDDVSGDATELVDGARSGSLCDSEDWISFDVPNAGDEITVTLDQGGAIEAASAAQSMTTCTTTNEDGDCQMFNGDSTMRGLRNFAAVSTTTAMLATSAGTAMAAPPPGAGDRPVRGQEIVLRAGPNGPSSFVPPSRRPDDAGRPTSPNADGAVPNDSLQDIESATFVVDYNGFEDYPDAQAAFEYAVSLWEDLIESAPPIELTATWAPADGNKLGSASSPYVIPSSWITGAPADTYYPLALAQAMAGGDTNFVPESPDINATFYANASWYFGLDGAGPAGTYDFVSVVMHEIGHGLGFMGGMRIGPDDALGRWSYDAPTIWDRFTELSGGTDLISLAQPSSTLADALKSGDVFFNGPNAIAGEGGSRPELYAPPSWNSGSSYSHLDETIYPRGNANSLMTPLLGGAEAIHSPGPIGIGVLRDMGWITADAPPQACIEDGFEDNDSLAGSVALTNGIPIHATRCPGDEDWFSIDVAEGDDLTVTLEHTALNGNLNLALHNASGEPITSTSTSTDIDTLTATDLAEGTYHVAVVPAGADDQGDYVLTLVTAFCPPDDTWEQNDSVYTSVALPSEGSVVGARCAGDDDWFTFESSGGDVTVILDHSVAVGDLSLGLYEPAEGGGYSGLVWDSHTGGEYVTRTLDPGIWSIRVSSSTNEEAPYVLAVSGAVIPNCDDIFEEDDSLATAKLLLDGARSGSLCDDADWMSFTVPSAGDNITAALIQASPEPEAPAFTAASRPAGSTQIVGTEPLPSGFEAMSAPDTGDLDITLYGPNGAGGITELADSGDDPEADVEILTFTAAASGTHYLKIHSPDGATSDYQVSVTIETPCSPCRFEQSGGGFTYSGSWSTWSAAGHSGGSVAASSSSGAAVDFVFTGPEVALVSALGPNRAKLGVEVDGVQVGVVDLYSPYIATQREVFRVAGLDPTVGHTLRVVHLGEANAAVSGAAWAIVDAVEAASVFVASRFEQSGGGFTYSGSWSTWSAAGHSGGSVAASSSSGAAVDFVFTGPEVALVSALGPNRAKLGVEVDGVQVGVVDLYSPYIATQREVFRVAGLDPTVGHTLRVVHLGEANAAVSGAAWAIVDAVEAASVFVASRFEQSGGGFTYSGSWSTWSAAGHSGGSVAASSSSGAAVDFVFTGPEVALVSALGPNRAKLGVEVDGVQVGVVDLYSPYIATQREVFRVAGLDPTVGHTLRVVHLGEANAAVSGAAWAIVDAVEAASVFVASRFEQSGGGFTYSGSWSTWSAAGHSGGSVAASSSSGAAVDFVFTGPEVALVSALGPNRAKLGVEVDGVQVGVVDLYSPYIATQREVFRVAGLDPTVGHTLRVVHLGEANAAVSGAAWAIVDAVEAGGHV